MQSSAAITELLIDWSNGNEKAMDELFPLVEKELNRLAHAYLRKMKPGATLQTTAVINEMYLKLVNQNQVEWKNRAHFFAVAATMMRRFLINYLRDSQAGKRGGKFEQVELKEVSAISTHKSEEILALEEALKALAVYDERKAKIVELRYFGGLNNKEIAEILKLTEQTVSREWSFAKAWLGHRIRNG